MAYKLIGLFTLITVISCIPGSDVIDLSKEDLKRSRRQTTFRNQTQLSFQFNLGVSTPTPLKTIYVNYIFQANFNMPWNYTVIPWELLMQNAPIVSRSRRDDQTQTKMLNQLDYNSEGRLHHLYKYLEDILSGHGHNGRPCLLKTMCQLAAEPLQTNHEEDLLLDIVNFVFNPHTSVEHKDTPREAAVHSYIEAFDSGRNGLNCERLYKSCSMTFIDYFTKFY